MTDDEKQALKQAVMAERGYWSPFHDYLLAERPEFLAAYLDFQQAPIRSGVLPKKLCEFIYIAIDVSVNHMYARGGQRHMGFALEMGATREELLQVLLLTSVVSARQPLERGMAILRDIGGDRDGSTAADPSLEESDAAYDVAMRAGNPLSPKETALISLAICSAPTCLHEAGIRRHMEEAVAAGATSREIAAVLQLSGALAVHTCTIGIPALQDALEGKPIE